MPEDLGKVMDRIRKLLALADHPNTPPHEADNARQRADAMMFQYRIEEATAVAGGLYGDDEHGMKPIWRVLHLSGISTEFFQSYRSIGNVIVNHVGAQVVFTFEQGESVMDACGYKSDLMYADVLLTSCLLEFGKRLEPKYDANLSDAENIYILRSAGMERRRISALVFGPWETENEMKAKNRKVTKIFKAEAERRGEDPSALLGRGNSVKTYRSSYADGFVSQLHQRLYRMRSAHGQESGAIVLADRSERVKEAFYEKYPQYRPAEVDPNAPAPKIRYRKFKPRPHNPDAFNRGGVAALNVDLGRNPTGTGRVDRGGRGAIG